MGIIRIAEGIALSILLSSVVPVYAGQETAQETESRLIKHGKYLARIGVCAACHTPPVTAPLYSNLSTEQSALQLRANPDWFAYLDNDRAMSGGVPFVLRFSANSSGLVVTRNLTPDRETGLGDWSTEEIKTAIKRGVRKDGSLLFLFAPHTFYANLADEDVTALALYLQSLKPVKHEIPARQLPFPAAPAQPASTLSKAPTGSSVQRGQYLLRGLVGCIECHSHQRPDGSLAELAGGLPGSGPISGVFRLGPDLALQATERGFAAFPFPGYAALYSDNLTRFGKGGDLERIGTTRLMKAIRSGVSIFPDQYGRPNLIAHTMMWQFYKEMTDSDTRAIIRTVKNSKFEPGYSGPRLIYFGEDWESLFKHLYGESPSDNDKLIFGKTKK
ncbi:hypothetical protein LPN04_28200 [Rugamonas sp. A1-17]|nr:hypothetical protein [Rugamonas sp. A1-17]